MLLVTLSGCSRAVAIDVPRPPEDIRATCLHLHSILPGQISGQSSRSTTPESELTAAWGEPPIALRCGVPRPAAYDPTAQVISVDDVDWFPEQREDGYVFTTVGRVADVQVRVPAAYAPEVNPLTALADPVERAVAKVPH